MHSAYATQYATHTRNESRRLHDEYGCLTDRLSQTRCVSSAWRLCIKLDALSTECRQADANMRHAERMLRVVSAERTHTHGRRTWTPHAMQGYAESDNARTPTRTPTATAHECKTP